MTALGIVAERPQRSEDLQQEPDPLLYGKGERPYCTQKKSRWFRQAQPPAFLLYFAISAFMDFIKSLGLESSAPLESRA